MVRLLFPKDFYWGASISAHQVEGGNHNQWSVWELENAKQLAETAAERLDWLPNWDDIKGQAQTPSNYVSGRGIDHFNRYEEDFDLLQSLNLNALRFSIEWSRLEPTEGAWDVAAVDYYKTYIKELRRRGIEPFMTLWHWTNPVWFEKKGGFAKAGNIKYFTRYVQRVAELLCEDVDYIIVLNEPNLYAWYSYAAGDWPPQRKSYRQFVRVYFNLVRAHRLAYNLLHKAQPHLHVASAPQLVSNVAKDPENRWQRLNARWADFSTNWLWLNLCRGRQDFVGLNNYFKNYTTGFGPRYGFHNPIKPLNDLGWYMEPEAVAEIARKVHKHFPRLPIIITEHGLADASDKQRRWWLEQTITALHGLLADNVPLLGYLHWSLLDNFEWAYGWWPKFGLIAVDRNANNKRTLRASAIWWGHVLGKFQGKTPPKAPATKPKAVPTPRRNQPKQLSLAAKPNKPQSSIFKSKNPARAGRQLLS